MTSAILDERNVKLEPVDLAVWGTDWTRSFKVDPLAILLPTSVEEVQRIVNCALTHGYELVPSGGRTGLSGGAVGGPGQVVVSFDRMNKIVDFNPTDRIVTCEAGVVTQQLQTFAVDHDLFYPVDFASSGSSQIGGNIATNAGGIRVIRYGLTRDWVAGLTVVTGTGEVLKLNRGLVKNATGYDLRHLFVGSEGTLGFIVEAQIRLLPPPKEQRVMVLAVPDLSDLLNILRRFQMTVELSAFEFFSELAMQKVLAHRDLQQPFASENAFYALLEYDAAMDTAATQSFEDSVAHGWVTDGVLSQSQAQLESLWQLREGITESIARYTPYKNDISVKIVDIPAFLDDVNGIVMRHYPELEVCWFGHIGDGNLHLNILKPDAMSQEEFYSRCHKISPLLFDIIRKRDGSISAEHGVGLLKRDFLTYSREPEEIAAMRAIKKVFDPQSIMNPGKIFVH